MKWTKKGNDHGHNFKLSLPVCKRLYLTSSNLLSCFAEYLSVSTVCITDYIVFTLAKFRCPSSF